ncbi:hypothetical protein ACLKA6_007449 [Drosophila palustris]
MDCIDQNAFEDDDNIVPCRACGIYFLSDHAVIHPIFTKTGAGENSNGNMPEIVHLMNEWSLQVKANDGRPQNMCRGCIAEFQKILKFKRSCLETQEQFDVLDHKRAHNGVVIKKEIEPEQTFCGFIYLDTDDEDDGSEEDGSRRVCAPLDIPHVPIKMEHTARVPQETPYQQTIQIQVASNLPEEATFSQIKPQELATANGLSPTLLERSQESEDEIIKFTYDDDCDGDGEELTLLPAPTQETGVYCKLCGHASPTQERHTEHMSRMHMLKDCECHICGKKFVNAHESRLRFHMKWHKLQKHLKCPICGFFCNSKDTLKEHKLAVHTRAKCEFCGKQMKQQQLQAHLNRHIKEHEEELALKLRSMQTAETLETPALSTTTEQESCLIQCAFCEFHFIDADQLQVHVQEIHTTSPAAPPKDPEADLDPELLEMVDVSTIFPDTFNAMHTNTNAIQDASNSSKHSDTSNRPSVVMYKCPFCAKSFNLKIKLNRHLQLHTKDTF